MNVAVLSTLFTVPPPLNCVPCRRNLVISHMADIPSAQDVVARLHEAKLRAGGRDEAAHYTSVYEEVAQRLKEQMDAWPLCTSWEVPLGHRAMSDALALTRAVRRMSRTLGYDVGLSAATDGLPAIDPEVTKGCSEETPCPYCANRAGPFLTVSVPRDTLAAAGLV